MRILVHDYGGYAFPYQLSLELARRGHFVSHAYCADLVTTPPGVPDEADEPLNLSVDPISLGAPLQKYDFVTRWRQERAYGRLIAEHTRNFGPDIVLSANTPLDALLPLQRTCRRDGAAFVFWLQDLLGVAAYEILRQRIPVAGDLIGRYYRSLERRLLRRSDAVVAISPAFLPVLQDAAVPEADITIIPNWAPLDRLPTVDKTNPWSRELGLDATFNFLYAGTLGMKHNPDRLRALADAFRDDPDVRVVVISQALGAEWLGERAAAEGLSNLILLPYQPVEALPEVLASADVLVALLEPGAGGYSVPSKVMTYLCAGRPLLLAVPPDNAAAEAVQEAGAGEVVDPRDEAAFLEAARRLRNAPERRAEMGRQARAYAEQTFDLGAITDRFDTVFETVLDSPNLSR